MPVTQNKYLVGRIVETNYLSSRVLLLNDLNSRIPVTFDEKSTQAILTGVEHVSQHYHIYQKIMNLKMIPWHTSERMEFSAGTYRKNNIHW